MLFRPTILFNLYAGALGLAFMSAFGTLVQLATGVRIEQFHSWIGGLSHALTLGAGAGLAVERTRARMHLEVELAGGYLRRLLSRGRV